MKRARDLKNNLLFRVLTGVLSVGTLLNAAVATADALAPPKVSGFAENEISAYTDTINFIRDVKFQNFQKMELTPGFVNEPYLDFFNARTQIVDGPNSEASKLKCPAAADSMVMAMMGKDKNITICPAFVKKYDNVIERSAVLIHEARHSENYPHVACTDGPNKNAMVLACDNAFNEGGAYAINIEYLARLHLYATNLTNFQRVNARMKALGDLRLHFNHGLLYELNTGAIARATNGDLYRIDGHRALPLGIRTARDSKIFSSENGIYLVLPMNPLESVSSFSLYASDQMPAGKRPARPNDYAQADIERLNHLSPADRLNLTYFRRYYGTELVITSGRTAFKGYDGKVIHFGPEIPDVDAVLSDLPQCAGPLPHERMFLHAKDENVFVLDFNTSKITHVKCAWPKGQTYGYLGGEDVYLRNGRLLVEGEKSKMKNIAPGLIFNLLTPESINDYTPDLKAP